MNPSPNRPRRPNSLRKKNYNYSQVGHYYIAINVANSSRFLGFVDEDCKMHLSDAGEIVKKFLLELPERFEELELDCYAILPNQVRFILLVTKGAIHESPLPPTQNPNRQALIPKAVGYLKMNSAKAINQKYRKSQKFWQRGYFDHITKSQLSLEIVREAVISSFIKWRQDRFFI